MKVDFVRFNATDGVELQGWLSDTNSDTVVLHIHGMSGNGFENVMLDNLRVSYTGRGIAFMTINTRGAGTINELKKGNETILGGSCYELLDESGHDIQGAVDYLRSAGKTRIILQGHSLGCTKVVNYVLNSDEKTEKVILLAPTDMIGWANAQGDHEMLYAKAERLIAESNPQGLVDFSCWLNKTPLSAKTYISLSTVGTIADIYNPDKPLIQEVKQPMLIAYGTADIGITEIDGSIDAYLDRTNKIKNDTTSFAIIKDANHGFTDHADELTKATSQFVAQS